MRKAYIFFGCMLGCNLVSVLSFLYQNHADPILYLNAVGIGFLGYWLHD